MTTPFAAPPAGSRGMQRYEREPGSQGNGAAWRPSAPDGSGDGLARALGWVSLGLGLAGIAAPGTVAQLIGVRDDENNRNLLRMVGIREIASGVGLLAQPAPGWAWSRVAGDMMDLALLTAALNREESQREKVVAATAAVAGIAAVDLYAAETMRSAEDGNGYQPGGQQRNYEYKTITVRKPVEECYRFWRDFTHLPRFMRHLEEVRVLDDRRSHWTAAGPGDVKVQWDAEIVEDLPNQRIAWGTLPGADIHSFHLVQFNQAPRDQGTEIRWEMRWEPPAGMLGAVAARLFGKSPNQTMLDDLRAYKQLLELGEIVRSDGALYAPTFPQRPAQPPTARELAGRP